MGGRASTGHSDDKLRSDIAVKLHTAKKSRRVVLGNRTVLEDALSHTGNGGTVTFEQFKRASERVGVRATDRELRAAFGHFDAEAGGRLNSHPLVGMYLHRLGVRRGADHGRTAGDDDGATPGDYSDG